MNKENILKRLNELFAEEIEAGIRYLHLACTLKGLDRLLVRKVLLENIEETLEHAQSIGEKMLHLGGAASLKLKLDLEPQRVSGAEALKTSLAFEQAALDAYRDLLHDVEELTRTEEGRRDEQLPIIEEFLREQVAVESRHVAEIALLLEG